MYTNTLTAQIAQQHIQDLHREAKARRLGRQVTARASRVPTAHRDLSWLTIKRFHVTPAH